MAGPGKGFGSFHTADVEVLVRQSEAEYTPIPQPVHRDFVERDVEFGIDARERLFLLDKDFTFVNHGAFGAANRHSFEIAQQYQLYLVWCLRVLSEQTEQ